MSTVTDIYPKIASIIADVLALDEHEVGLKKRLIADLGAESIDFLDLIFQLEQEFKVKIPRGQIEKQARGNLTEAEFEEGGQVTERGLQALKEYMPEVPADFYKEKMKVSEIPTLFTVETLCHLVLRAQKEAALQTA